MSYAQLASYQEIGTFSLSLSSLGLEMLAENDLYRFGIAETGRRDMAYQYALNKTDDAPSFLNVVLVEVNADSGESLPASYLRESEMMAAIALSELPTIESPDGFFNCPAGWKLIN